MEGGAAATAAAGCFESKEPRETADRTESKRCSQHCSEEPRETAGSTKSEAPSRNNVAKEESLFQVDLQVHGVSQDDIYKDEERMTEMQNLVDRLQDGCHDRSIVKDLKRAGVSNVFSEESKRKLKEMGSIELYELSETVTTPQCLICLKPSKSTINCGCG